MQPSVDPTQAGDTGSMSEVQKSEVEQTTGAPTITLASVTKSIDRQNRGISTDEDLRVLAYASENTRRRARARLGLTNLSKRGGPTYATDKSAERKKIMDQLTNLGYTKRTAKTYTQSKNMSKAIFLINNTQGTFQAQSSKEGDTRTCKSCGIVKPATTEFFKEYKKSLGITLTFTCRTCYNKKHREYIRKRYEGGYRSPAGRNQYLKSYGITVKEYDTMLKLQDGKCYICGGLEHRFNKKGERMRLSVDHNHKNGNIRKLVCSKCNQKIYVVESSENIEDDVTKIIQYLKEHSTEGNNQ